VNKELKSPISAYGIIKVNSIQVNSQADSTALRPITEKA
jgi:hypothetical protein